MTLSPDAELDPELGAPPPMSRRQTDGLTAPDGHGLRDGGWGAHDLCHHVPGAIATTQEDYVALRSTVQVVHALYRDGVDSVDRISSRLTPQSWEAPACGGWTGTETARHLLAVARWYHDWLDRAIGGDPSSPFPPSELDERNDAALLEVAALSGTEAVAEFVETASSYLGRTAEHWDLPFGYPFGTVTVGLHCGVAAAEWHLHAWDLSATLDLRHRPQDPQALFTAAGMCVAEAHGGVRGRMLRRLVPLGAKRNPWATIVKRSGRIP